MSHAFLRFKKKVGAWRHGGGASGPAAGKGGTAATAHGIARPGLMSGAQLKWEPGKMTVAWLKSFTS